MPDLNVVQMLANIMASPIIIGWITHFTIGTIIWGGAFAILVDKLPGGPLTSAIIFSIGTWLLMMIALMPMVGAGLFGLQLSTMTQVSTLILHVIWGVVLGISYKKLTA